MVDSHLQHPLSPSAKRLPVVTEFDVIDDYDEDMEKELNRVQLAILTCTLGGLQVTWSTLNGNVNVFLTSIGISKAVSPLIWIIAPLSGTFVQPLVGWWSDGIETKYGRRKPFILFGALGTSIGLLGLFWTKYICMMLSGMAEPSTGLISAVALVWVILTNVSVQPLQMGIRTMFIDGAPKSQQAQVNAWGNTCLSVGNVLGYLLSLTASSISINVAGFNHYNLLAVVASVCLAVTATLNLLLSHEQYTGFSKRKANNPSIKALIRYFRSMNMVSPRTKIVYQVQFAAWMGWFPYTFYMVSFVTGKQDNTASAQASVTQPGQLAAFLYAVVSCIGALVIPMVLRKNKNPGSATDPNSTKAQATMFGISLEKIWAISQVIFAILMFCTAFTFNTTSAIIVIALGGIPWSLSNYIPYALIAVELAQQRSRPQNKGKTNTALTATTSSSSATRSSTTHRYHDDETQIDPDMDSDSDSEPERDANPADELLNPQQSKIDEEDETAQPLGAGATSGLHNASLSAPQIIAVLISSGVLALTDKINVGDGYGWVLRLAGVAALVSCVFIRKLF